MHVGRHVRRGSHVHHSTQQANEKKLSALNDVVLVGDTPEGPGAIHQVAVHDRASKCDCFKNSKHRSRLPGVKKKDKNVQDGEIDNCVDDPHNSEPKDLHDVRVAPWVKWRVRIHQCDRAI